MTTLTTTPEPITATERLTFEILVRVPNGSIPVMPLDQAQILIDNIAAAKAGAACIFNRAYAEDNTTVYVYTACKGEIR